MMGFRHGFQYMYVYTLFFLDGIAQNLGLNFLGITLEVQDGIRIPQNLLAWKMLIFCAAFKTTRLGEKHDSI